MTTKNRRVGRTLNNEFDKTSSFESPRETKQSNFYQKHIPESSTASEDNYDPIHSDVSSIDLELEKCDSKQYDKKNKNVEDKHKQLKLPKIDHDGATSLISHRSESHTSNRGDEKNRLNDEIRYSEYPILRRLQDSVIGKDLVIGAPYGPRKVVYCDYTASGRCLSFIEDYIRDHVFPTYANTHSTTGHNARQTGKFREEARSMIKKCVNAGKDDAVIFTGSGATAGMHKLAWALKINQPRVAEETVLFIGPYEHHSNILPWREYGTQVVRIRYVPKTGLIDLKQLQNELKFWKEKRRHLLVCMSATSNVTGIITDVDAVSKIAHSNGALVVFDYAAGGPYLKIDMNASKSASSASPGLVCLHAIGTFQKLTEMALLEDWLTFQDPRKEWYKDAVIFSPHKFVGGPGTPGLIIAKKWVFRNSVPDRVGGGTVKFVTRDIHAYVSNIEEKEEGGTPAIIESIRAGLVFQLKEEVGTDIIDGREEDLCRRAFEVWERNPCIYILGSHTAKRIPIISFLTKHLETGRLIHHNFVSTLLSDMFGVQARGGCACAGPYAEDLMGISEPVAKKYLEFLSEKPGRKDSNQHVSMEIMKPGFTRINLSYFVDDDTTDFIIEAVDIITRHGWKLLPQYTFDSLTGSWKHKDFSNTEGSELKTLADLCMTETQPKLPAETRREDAPPYKEVLKTARTILEDVEENAKGMRIGSASLKLRDYLPKEKRALKWFLTPYEAANVLADKSKTYLDKTPYRLPFKLSSQENRTLFDDDDSDYHSDKALTDRSEDPRDKRINDSYGQRASATEETTETKSPRKPKRASDHLAEAVDSYTDGRYVNNTNGNHNKPNVANRANDIRNRGTQSETKFPDIREKNARVVYQREQHNNVIESDKAEIIRSGNKENKLDTPLTDRSNPSAKLDRSRKGKSEINIENAHIPRNMSKTRENRKDFNDKRNQETVNRKNNNQRRRGGDFEPVKTEE